MELTETEMQAREYICADVGNIDNVMEVVQELKDLVGYFKIHGAFFDNGPDIIDQMKKAGVKIFLDLKFHDIPHTVANYARIATRFGVDMFNLHISGGSEMIKAAVDAATDEAEKGCTIPPKIIGVTVLTSLDSDALEALDFPKDVQKQVVRLAKLGIDAGLDGIVCSAADLKLIKPQLPNDMFYVTPGIRPIGVDHHDQKRVMTPANAVADGSSLLVIGRAITGAKDKKKAAYDIVKDIASQL